MIVIDSNDDGDVRGVTPPPASPPASAPSPIGGAADAAGGEDHPLMVLKQRQRPKLSPWIQVKGLGPTPTVRTRPPVTVTVPVEGTQPAGLPAKVTTPAGAGGSGAASGVPGGSLSTTAIAIVAIVAVAILWKG